jgi:signal peptidase I
MPSSPRLPSASLPHATMSALRFAHRRQPAAGLSLLGMLLLLVVIGFVVHTFFFTVYRVRQDGMFPAFGSGSVLFAQRKPYAAAGQIKRGDVVIFEHTHDGQEYRFVWRVVALPRETVAMEGTNVWINGTRLAHEVVNETNDTTIFRETNRDRAYKVAYDRHSSHPALPLRVTVPDGQVFVLGDSRHDALDSTYLGPIPFEEIVAKKF